MSVGSRRGSDGSYVLEFSLPEEFMDHKGFDYELNSMMRSMARDALSFWKTEAGRRLKSSRKAYQDSIRMDMDGSSGFSIRLEAPAWIYALEMGSGPYPMNVAKGQIVPLNVNRNISFNNPRVYRTGNGTPWIHPGFAGVLISDAVALEIESVLLPKHLDKLLGSL